MKKGLDLSSHQGAVRWNEVTAEFAMIRAGWSWYQGGMNVDTRFTENAAGAEEAGIPWGAYLYAYDRTPEAAVKSAGRLSELLAPYRLQYPVAYDFEDNRYFSNSKAVNTAVCRAFLEEMRKRGFYVMLYTYTGFANGYLNMADLAGYDLWIADYTGKVGWKGEYGMWQYTGSGSMAGVTGPVDLDYAYKDYPFLIRAAGLNGFGPAVPTPEEDLQKENRLLRQRLAEIARLAAE